MIMTDPLKDRERLQEIANLRLHDGEVDDILNEYVEEAARVFNLPVSLATIILDSAQVFAAESGLEGWAKEANGTPVEWSFCVHSVRSGKPLVVEDAQSHDLVKNNPSVTRDNVRCYAGVPLITSNGHIVGNFCVIGNIPRKFTDEEIEKLEAYATKTIRRIENRLNR